MPLEPPPRDVRGEVIPHDHEGILPDDGIIRRISEQQLIRDDKTGGRRILLDGIQAVFRSEWWLIG